MSVLLISVNSEGEVCWHFDLPFRGWGKKFTFLRWLNAKYLYRGLWILNEMAHCANTVNVHKAIIIIVTDCEMVTGHFTYKLLCQQPVQ